MANIPETPTFDTSVYQIETTDKVLGGPDGVINVQAKQLADRTAFLKVGVEAVASQAASAEGKADSALSQIADVELAVGSASASATAADQHRQAALAAQALAEQAKANAEADAAAAAAAATGAAADRVLAGQRAAEAQASAAAAVSAASAAVAALSSMRNLPTFADNASAIAGGLAEGYIYKTPTGEVRAVV